MSPLELLNLEKVPKSKKSQKLLNRMQSTKKQCISFAVNKAKCAIDIAAIQEIVKLDTIANSALSVGICMGTIDLRGHTIPIIDTSALLGYEEKIKTDDARKIDERVIIMKICGESFGLLVDRVDSIVHYYEEELLSFPSIGIKKTKLFKGCILSEENNSEKTIVLSSDDILSSDEIHTITKGYSKLYQEQQEEE